MLYYSLPEDMPTVDNQPSHTLDNHPVDTHPVDTHPVNNTTEVQSKSASMKINEWKMKYGNEIMYTYSSDKDGHTCSMSFGNNEIEITIKKTGKSKKHAKELACELACRVLGCD